MLSVEELPAHLSLIPASDWNDLFVFLPELSKPKVKDKVVNDMMDQAYFMQLVVAFDWVNWKEGAALLNTTTTDYASLDAITLCKLLAMMIRAERFEEGSIKTRLKDGSLVKVLEGLKRRFKES